MEMHHLGGDGNCSTQQVITDVAAAVVLADLHRWELMH